MSSSLVVSLLAAQLIICATLNSPFAFVSRTNLGIPMTAEISFARLAFVPSSSQSLLKKITDKGARSSCNVQLRVNRLLDLTSWIVEVRKSLHYGPFIVKTSKYNY
jgi:hypothetical protein